MKKINIKILTGFIVIVAITSSCKKWIDDDYNVNQTKPQDVTLNLILPSAEASLAYCVGGDLGYATNLWMQQMSGSARQVLAYDRYVFTSSDDDNAWSFAMYGGAMENIYKIIEKGKAQNSPYYTGIGEVLMAYSLGSMTDLWGSIPYKQAFQGDKNLTPAFDSQQSIYVTIDSLLNDAINVQFAASTSLYTPSTDDLIYSGSRPKWIKAAYAFRARYAIHLSKVPGSNAYANALSYLSSAISANSGDCEFTFGANQNEENPLYQFFDQRGDFGMAKFMVDTLFHSNDPRGTVFIDTTYGTGALAPGVGGVSDAWIAYPFCSETSPVPFISYVECLFIKAEAELQGSPSDPAAAAADYNAAIAASLSKYGVTDSAWLSTHANATAADITLQKIMTQKYIALFLQLEVYNDWRRTGFPVLVPSINGAISSIPRRYPYPTSEKLYNSKNCPTSGVSLTDRVWWDQ